MQNRIDRLEGLVLSLMTNGNQAPGTAAAQQALSSAGAGSMSSGSLISPNIDESLDEMEEEMGEDESETDKVTKSFGVMKVDAERQKTFYIGESHWAALLSEISEVKNYFAEHKREYEAQIEKVARTTNQAPANAPGPALLFGSTNPPGRNEIMSQMPSRYLTDILVGRYFNTFDPAIHILHGPTFQKQYNQHWVDPAKTSIVWIGMLFAMLRLAMLSYAREGDEPPEFRGKCKDMASNFRTQMAHCLITADYTRPHNFLIETLILHMNGEYVSKVDAEASVWVLAGMIARLAMRMGYHRDSKLFPNITPFQGEMRRRVWTFVRYSDILFSFQIALPCMIRMGDTDTDIPRNIHDDEFDEDSLELPPARPLSEVTSVSYMIAKAKLVLGFGRVLEETNGVVKHGYDEVLKIDRGLRDVFESIPEHLRLRPMSEQTMAPISLIMARYSLATTYHKSQCVLHRRFIRLAKTNSKYAYSRRTCLDSSMQLLSYQAIQHEQTQERGRLRSIRAWSNSLTTHDYLLAATVICHDLYTNNDAATSESFDTPSTSSTGRSGSASDSFVPGLAYTRNDFIQALETSCGIWKTMTDVSMEAFKASELLRVMLEHFCSPRSQQTPLFPNTAVPVNDEQNAAMTLGLLQSGQAQQQQQQMLQKNYVENMDQMFQPDIGQYPGAFNAATPMPNSGFTGGFFGGTLGSGDYGSMNLDWVSLRSTTFALDALTSSKESFDQYMPPGNLSLDPAANLWSSGSPNANGFSSGSSPDSNSNAFNVNANIYATQSIGDVMQQQPTLSPNAPPNSDNSNSNAGQVFMGVGSPQPWRFTVMNEEK